MKTNKQKFIGFSLLAVFALVLSACGGKSKEPTPTPLDPNLIAAQAIATFAMGLTQTAFAQPTATLTPEPIATNTIAPTFAALGTNTGAPPVNTCDMSVWVSDVNYPDGTPVAPGQQFTKKWIYKNTGTCTWTPNYKIAFGSIGIAMNGQTTLLGKTVKPGEQVEISIDFIAPPEGGDYESHWKFQNEQGQFFGQWLWVKIKVAGATAAATDTPEPTETPAATP